MKHLVPPVNPWSGLTEICLFLFPIAAGFFFLGFKILHPAAYTDLIQEDAAVENLQAVLYFVSAVVAFTICLKSYHCGHKSLAGVHLVLFLGLLLVCLEEISWGQRLLDIKTPPLMSAYNTQNEITLHNLRPIQCILRYLYMLVGLYGSLAWLVMRKLHFKGRDVLSFFVPERRCALYFFFLFSTYVILEYSISFSGNVIAIGPFRLSHFFDRRDQEPAELMLALGSFLFVLENRKKSKALLARPAASP